MVCQLALRLNQLSNHRFIRLKSRRLNHGHFLRLNRLRHPRSKQLRSQRPNQRQSRLLIQLPGLAQNPRFVLLESRHLIQHANPWQSHRVVQREGDQPAGHRCAPVPALARRNRHLVVLIPNVQLAKHYHPIVIGVSH